jgi:WD40 repeat protein
LDDISYVANYSLIDIIDHATKTIVGNFRVGSYVRCIALSRDKASLLVGCDDGTARVLDIITGQIRHLCRGHSMRIECIIAGSGDEIITCSLDKSIKRWTSKGFCVRTYIGHSRVVFSVIFSAKRNRIYSASDDHSIRAWDYDSGVEVAKMLGYKEAVVSLAWVQGEETFVSGSHDNSVRLWDATGMVLIKVIGTHADYVRSVAASPDGRYIVSGGWDNKVNIWDVETSQLVHSLAHHGNGVDIAAISSNGAFLGSSDYDNIFLIHKIDPPLSTCISKNKRIKIESEEALELTASTASSAQLWVEAISAVIHNLLLDPLKRVFFQWRR